MLSRITRSGGPPISVGNFFFAFNVVFQTDLKLDRPWSADVIELKGEVKTAGALTKYIHCLRRQNPPCGVRLYVPLTCEDGRKLFNRGLILNLGHRRATRDTAIISRIRRISQRSVQLPGRGQTSRIFTLEA
jgi:hypothetical protein